MLVKRETRWKALQLLTFSVEGWPFFLSTPALLHKYEEAKHVHLQNLAPQWVPLVPRCDPLGYRDSRKQGREGHIWLTCDWNSSRQVDSLRGCFVLPGWGGSPFPNSVEVPIVSCWERRSWPMGIWATVKKNRFALNLLAHS